MGQYIVLVFAIAVAIFVTFYDFDKKEKVDWGYFSMGQNIILAIAIVTFCASLYLYIKDRAKRKNNTN